MTDEEDWTLYEFQIYDAEGKFLIRLPCVPPFEVAPGVLIHETRYFVLMDNLTYHEAGGVHWLPKTQQLQARKEKSHADPNAK